MDELKKIFENSAALPDELKETLTVLVKEAEEARESEYQKKLEESLNELRGLIPEMVNEAVADETKELVEELAEARTLEISYADKMEQFKENYANKMEELIPQLVSEGIEAEIAELKEDIEVAKKFEFAKKLVESFGEAYAEFTGAEVSNVNEAEELRKELESLKRSNEINRVLEGIEGRKRKVFETVLEGVSSDKVESKFNTVKDFVLGESESNDNKNSENLNESDKNDKDKIDGTIVIESEKDSDQPEKISESQLSKSNSAIVKALRAAKL